MHDATLDEMQATYSLGAITDVFVSGNWAGTGLSLEDRNRVRAAMVKFLYSCPQGNCARLPNDCNAGETRAPGSSCGSPLACTLEM